MATWLRLRRCITIDSHSLFSVSVVRCSSSSSSSSSSSGKSKAENKLVDRLSAVIDAVNDRKLPPELRGQSNNVRISIRKKQHSVSVKKLHGTPSTKVSAYVFVGGIPFDLTEGDLLTVFAQYWEVVD